MPFSMLSENLKSKLQRLCVAMLFILLGGCAAQDGSITPYGTVDAGVVTRSGK